MALGPISSSKQGCEGVVTRRSLAHVKGLSQPRDAEGNTSFKYIKHSVDHKRKGCPDSCSRSFIISMSTDAAEKSRRCSSFWLRSCSASAGKWHHHFEKRLFGLLLQHNSSLQWPADLGRFHAIHIMMNHVDHKGLAHTLQGFSVPTYMRMPTKRERERERQRETEREGEREGWMDGGRKRIT